MTVIASIAKQSRSLDRHAALGRLAMTMLATGLNSYNIRSLFNATYNANWNNSFDRRFNELKIQLPRPPQTVHVIKADDPSGIEKCWRKGFESKRKNGEWFKGTSNNSIFRALATRLPLIFKGKLIAEYNF